MIIFKYDIMKIYTVNATRTQIYWFIFRYLLTRTTARFLMLTNSNVYCILLQYCLASVLLSAKLTFCQWSLICFDRCSQNGWYRFLDRRLIPSIICESWPTVVYFEMIEWLKNFKTGSYSGISRSIAKIHYSQFRSQDVTSSYTLPSVNICS